uniref:Uncharacterized protein n=1 Tax=Romanomermis culicivorax TaxID=13658 RepID=A0A915HNN3_ROMCU
MSVLLQAIKDIDQKTSTARLFPIFRLKNLYLVAATVPEGIRWAQDHGFLKLHTYEKAMSEFLGPSCQKDKK